MYFTVYKTTNLINGKIYVGVHKTEDLNDRYLGSGTYLNNAILKYGKENFSKDIIAICDTEEEMYKLEEDLVCKAFLTFFSTYNLRLGGDGGFDYLNTSGIADAGRSKGGLAASSNRKKDPEKLSKFRDLFKNTNKKTFLNKRHTKDSRLKMSLSKKGKYLGNLSSQYGTRWITNGVLDRKIKVSEQIPEGWRKGRVVGVIGSILDLHSKGTGSSPV